METITIFPENEKQKSLLKSLSEEMKVRFEEGRSDKQTELTEKEFIAKIDKSIVQAESGKTSKLTTDQQKNLFRLVSNSIELTEAASRDIEKHQISGDKKVLIKIDKLLTELR
jgi:monomeric isocitrate dehydrogenase